MPWFLCHQNSWIRLNAPLEQWIVDCNADALHWPFEMRTYKLTIGELTLTYEVGVHGAQILFGLIEFASGERCEVRSLPVGVWTPARRE